LGVDMIGRPALRTKNLCCRYIAVFVTVATVVSIALVPTAVGAAVTKTAVWTRTYQPPNGAAGTVIAVDSTDSTVFVGGPSWSPPREFLVGAYTADTGQPRWTMSYPCSDLGSDRCWVHWQLSVSPDGTALYLMGTDQSGTHRRDVVTMALNSSTGTLAWTRRSPSANDYNAPRMELSPTGDRIFVAMPVGPINDPARRGERVVAYEPTTGDLLWRVRILGNASASPQTLISVSPDGASVFLAVTKWGKSGERVKTVALDAATGTALWVRRFGRSTAHNLASDIAIAANGRAVYVSDYRYGYVPGGEGEMIRWPVVVAYDPADGSLLWKSVVVGAISDNMHIGIAAGTGQVFVTNGFAVGSLGARTGRSRWVTRTATLPGYWLAMDFTMVPSPDGGRVFANVALSDEGTGSKLRVETAAVDTRTGALRWTAVKRGVPWGFIAAGPSGARVYVAGPLPNTSGGYRGWFVTAYPS
jgi:outer membrane protein assembly factor BamB